MPRSSRAAAAAPAASTSRPAAAWATSSTRCSATSWAAAAAAAARGRAPAPTSAQAVEIDLAEAFAGTKAHAARADPRRLRGLQRHRLGGQGARRRDLRDLPRRRQGARPAGLLPHRAHLPDLRRRRPRDPQPLPHLPRRRHGAARAHACRWRSPPASRTARASACAGEGEAGGQGAPPGDLYVHVAIRPHPIFQRDGANMLLPRAAAHDARRRSAATSRCR